MKRLFSFLISDSLKNRLVEKLDGTPIAVFITQQIEKYLGDRK